jgi:ribosomal protein S3AE
MSQNFMSQTNRLWMEIYQIVKENCASEYSGATPMDDAMERLLRARKGN